jgi:hypothetical protein
MTMSDFEQKTVWVAWTNTDLTEGKGFRVPLVACELRSTAVRMGKKGSVMGSDCEVTEETALKRQGTWLVPGRIYPATRLDRELQKAADDKAAALQRAKQAGLSDDDLRLLSSSGDQ